MTPKDTAGFHYQDNEIAICSEHWFEFDQVPL
jgi:hypothetical protein